MIASARIETDPSALKVELLRQLERDVHWERSGANRAQRGVDGWSFEFFDWLNGGEDDVRVYQDYVASLSQPWTYYNPLKVESGQRNRVVTLPDLRRKRCEPAEQVFAHVYPKIGLDKHDQLRVVLADGPVCLSWFGGFRTTPFSARDKAFLQALVKPLQERLSLERKLADAGAFRQGLVSALEHIGAPAAFVRYGGVEVFANRAWRALPRRDRTNLAAEALRTETGRHLHVTPTRGGGRPEYALVVYRKQPELDARLTQAGLDWRLTRRQAQVLTWLVQGHANKTIAEQIGCAVGTVEAHITAILRRSQVESRSELLAKFWGAR